MSFRIHCVLGGGSFVLVYELSQRESHNTAAQVRHIVINTKKAIEYEATSIHSY